MKYYGDLRDYHNKRFIANNLETFFASAINIIGLTTAINGMCYINDGLWFDTLSGSVAAICMLMETDALYSGVKNINKDLKNIDLRSVLKERKRLYDAIINNICSCIKELNMTDPKYIMHFLNDVLNKGYLSYKKNFKNINVTSERLEFSSYQVINGNGVCRHIAQFTTDIFKCLGYEAFDLFCLEYGSDDKPRHMITMVDYNNKTYYLDTANNISYNYYEGVLKTNNNNFIPVNYYAKNFHQMDNDDLAYLISYYANRRNLQECMKCMFKKLNESYDEYDYKKGNNIKTNIIYEKNKKLYKKFRETYL